MGSSLHQPQRITPTATIEARLLTVENTEKLSRGNRNKNIVTLGLKKKDEIISFYYVRLSAACGQQYYRGC